MGECLVKGEWSFVFTNFASFELQDIPSTRISTRMPISRLENRRRIQAMKGEIEGPRVSGLKMEISFAKSYIK